MKQFTFTVIFIGILLNPVHAQVSTASEEESISLTSKKRALSTKISAEQIQSKRAKEKLVKDRISLRGSNGSLMNSVTLQKNVPNKHITTENSKSFEEYKREEKLLASIELRIAYLSALENSVDKRRELRRVLEIRDSINGK